jgi:gluconokinase
LRIAPEVHLVYLRAAPEVLQQRLRARHGHFMTEKMLESQLETLEEPEHVVAVNVDQSLTQIVAEIRARLRSSGNSSP